MDKLSILATIPALNREFVQNHHGHLVDGVMPLVFQNLLLWFEGALTRVLIELQVAALRFCTQKSWTTKRLASTGPTRALAPAPAASGRDRSNRREN